MDFLTATVSLFFVLNALGNIPMFLGILTKYSVHKQRQIIIRESLIALMILLLFGFFGEGILGLLGISEGVMCFTGGFILFVIAVQMLFPKNEPTEKESLSHEPFIVPLAFPAFAGPGAITNVMVLSGTIDNPLHVIGVVVGAWLVSSILLVSSSEIKKILGEKGMIACQKLGGLIIALISVSMVSKGALKMVDDHYGNSKEIVQTKNCH